jgi:acetoin utilization deacetylase AcuC-like enzyme
VNAFPTGNPNPLFMGLQLFFSPFSSTFMKPMNDIGLFYPDGHEAHFARGHPERPERIEVICTALQEADLWDRALQIPPCEVPQHILEEIHSPAYLSLLERSCRRGGYLDTDTYTTPASWELARQAAGGSVAVARSVWNRESQMGIALARPPGHHAMRGQGMGFCLLNNIAIAAEYILRAEGAQRVAIVDLDLHHGNGTQDIFWRRKDVLFISTHQRPLYPGTGALQERGAEEGLGYTANFPLPPGSGDRAFHTFMDEAILPLLSRFEPEMLLVSYGFDSHWSDPLGSLLLTATGYAGLIEKLHRYAVGHCNEKIILILEGGYNLSAAAICTVAVTKALLGEAMDDLMDACPYQESDTWIKVLLEAKRIWQL